MTAIATAAVAPAPGPQAPGKSVSSRGCDRFADEFAAAARAQAQEREQSVKSRRASERRADSHSEATKSPVDMAQAPHDGAAEPESDARVDSPQTSGAPGTGDSGTESQVAAAPSTPSTTADATAETEQAGSPLVDGDEAVATPAVVDQAEGLTVEPAVEAAATAPREGAGAARTVTVSAAAASAAETSSTAVSSTAVSSTAASQTKASSATTEAHVATAPSAVTGTATGTSTTGSATPLTETAAGAAGSVPDAGGGTAAQAAQVSAGTPATATPSTATTAGPASAGAIALPSEMKAVPPAEHTTKPALTVDGATAASTPAPATPTHAPPPPAAVAPSAPALPPQLASQLSGQLTSLRALPQGDHVLTLTVNPESFGPVKVVAHIGSDGLHLEIFGASEQARAALRAALPDLRRDLVGVGLDPRLDVGSGSPGDAKDESAMADPHGFGDKQAARTGVGARAGSPSAGDAPAHSTTSPSRVARQGGIDLDL